MHTSQSESVPIPYTVRVMLIRVTMLMADYSACGPIDCVCVLLKFARDRCTVRCGIAASLYSRLSYA